MSFRLLRIADVDNDRTGGMSRTMHCTGDELRTLGHTVDYWWGDRFPSSAPFQFRRFIVPRRVVRLMRELLRDGPRPDVVEVHEPVAAAYAWCRRRDRSIPPLIVFSYGLEERVRRATLDYRRRKGLPVSFKSRFSPLTVIWQAMYAVRHADHVVCSNSDDVAFLVNAGVPRERLTCHTSGADEEFFGILFLGSWVIRKGTHDLVPAIAEVLRQRPAARFTIVGSGLGSEGIPALFPGDVRPRITIHPQVEGNRRLIEIYREQSILVLPSFYEGQPLSMIEAATQGLAIVTTNVCGMKDFLTHEVDGMLLPVGDVPTLVSALLRLVDDPSQARRLGAKARERAVSHTWAAAARRLAEAYARVAGG
jgi:glycosyltransferase involved in cell wall biosynthesis